MRKARSIHNVKVCGITRQEDAARCAALGFGGPPAVFALSALVLAGWLGVAVRMRAPAPSPDPAGGHPPPRLGADG